MCRRFDISLDDREAKGHGALLDCQLLSMVYLELTGGRQPGLALATTLGEAGPRIQQTAKARQRPLALGSRVSASELDAHAQMIKSLKGDVIWSRKS